MELNLFEELTQPLFGFKIMSFPFIIKALFISPEIFIVGVACMGSLKVAVIVTTSVLNTKLSESVSESVNVGGVVSGF